MIFFTLLPLREKFRKKVVPFYINLLYISEENNSSFKGYFFEK